MVSIVQWLLPKEQKFFHMLKAQSENAVKGAKELKSFVYSYNTLNNASKIDFIKRLKHLETEGDELTHDITGILNHTFITPIDKEDIHNLSMLLDDLVDLIHGAAERLVIFRISSIDSYIKAMADIVLKSIEKIDQGIMEVSKLKSMNEFYVDIHTLENEGDDIFREALASLFDRENTVDIIKYKEIYELLEKTIDKCEVVANVIESVVVKHA